MTASDRDHLGTLRAIMSEWLRAIIGIRTIVMNLNMRAAKQGDGAEMWARKMIEHLRGGIAMSRVALQVANNAETKRMAQKGILEQEKSITELQGWLRTHGKRPQ